MYSGRYVYTGKIVCIYFGKIGFQTQSGLNDYWRFLQKCILEMNHYSNSKY
jgi:hypothetical protein